MERMSADIAELDAGKIGHVQWPEASDLTNMLLDVVPDQGLWKGAKYQFSIKVPDMYPHEPPKVHCNTKIYHPNIDLEGHVCLNILRDEWKPVLDINAGESRCSAAPLHVCALPSHARTASVLSPSQCTLGECDTSSLAFHTCLSRKGPTLPVHAVIYGIIYLFYEPNANDPLNHEAAALLRDNRASFEKNVATSLRGGKVGNSTFPQLLR